mmetsp:Transcript_14003/g.20916  ORF Transcript_14003/g.20916 Transcript_14003/m.20916 type:complete len:600 (-) Transcript_14003:55-1854(-)
MKSQHLSSALAALHVAIRISIANRAPITDCDEVFNYWEPLHFIQFGYGMQTWEYHFHYALRTYCYLLPLSLISKTLSFAFAMPMFTSATVSVTVGKYQMFAILRALIASFTAISEIRLANALTSQTLAVLVWIMLLTSAGMYHAAPAFLPSATVMVCFMNCMVEQLHKNMDRAIVWGLVSCLMTGWPFCAVLFIPLGFQAVYCAYRDGHEKNTSKRMENGLVQVAHLLMRVVLYAVLIHTLVTVIDYYYYGVIISPTWNIFKYNTGLGGDGINRDNLYGVEDVSYYIKNLLLNWNGVAIMGVLSMPLLIFKHVFRVGYPMGNSSSTLRAKDGDMIVILLPLYLWAMIVFSRPHKEERFLFPIYPILAVGAAVFLEHTIGIIGGCGIAKKSKLVQCNLKKIQGGIAIIILLPCSLVSISRAMALTDGYTAPLDLYSHLYRIMEDTSMSSVSTSETKLVCTGGEWYRFPSSFHLPPNARLAFLKSSFGGQLPQQFTKFGSKQQSQELLGSFNDLNQEEMDRYVDISECSYVIELIEKSEKKQEPECVTYMKEDQNQWDLIKTYDFLDADNTSLLDRVLYLPLKRNVTYKEYALFEKRQRNN